MSQQEPIVIYSSYTPAQRRASQKWNKKNWDYIKAKERERYHKRVENNQPFYELTRLTKAVDYYSALYKRRTKNV